LCGGGAQAHQRGTTVCLDGLFSKWPVRLNEFKRSLKKEYSKMVHLMHAYCLVRPDIRFTCSNQPAKGSRSTVLSTPGKKDVSATIGILFGQKQIKSMAAFVPAERPDADAASTAPTITGYISKPTVAAGRSAGDRHFLSVNSRPCEHKKLTKAVNEVFRQYVKNKSPVIVLDIAMPRANVDVNVTPDKRSIFFQREANLIDFVKESLTKMWEPSRNCFEQVDATSQGSMSQFLVDRKPSKSKQPAGHTLSGRTSSASSARSSYSSHMAAHASAADEADEASQDTVDTEPQETEAEQGEAGQGEAGQGVLDQVQILSEGHLGGPDSHVGSGGGTEDAEDAGVGVGAAEPDGHTRQAGAVSPARGAQDAPGVGREVWCCQVLGCVKYKVPMNSKSSLQAHYSSKHRRCKFPGPTRARPAARPSKRARGSHAEGEDAAEDDDNVAREAKRPAPTVVYDDDNDDAPPPDASPVQLDAGSNARASRPSQAAAAAVMEDDEDCEECGPDDGCACGQKPFISFSTGRRGGKRRAGRAGSAAQQQGDRPVDVRDSQLNAAASLPELTERELMRALKGSSRPRSVRKRFSFSSVKADAAAGPAGPGGVAQQFRSRIGTCTDAEAEAELNRVINHEDFAKMEILGQFNLGFIVVRLNEDLFIIDQVRHPRPPTPRPRLRAPSCSAQACTSWSCLHASELEARHLCPPCCRRRRALTKGGAACNPLQPQHATDEKYNFETLQQNTTLQSQPLVVPQRLQLTVVNEQLVIDHLAIFRKNGFDFVIDESAQPTERVRLRQIPISKGTVFGEEDVDEVKKTPFPTQDAHKKSRGEKSDPHRFVYSVWASGRDPWLFMDCMLWERAPHPSPPRPPNTNTHTHTHTPTTPCCRPRPRGLGITGSVRAHRPLSCGCTRVLLAHAWCRAVHR